MDEFDEIQERLDQIAAHREEERLASHKRAAEELAAATAKEQARITAAKEAQRTVNEHFAKIENDKVEAYQAFLQKEHEERLAIERVNDAKQAQLDHDAHRQEELKKVKADREYLEECEQKRLRDSLLPTGNADVVPQHPLARFLQHVPE